MIQVKKFKLNCKKLFNIYVMRILKSLLKYLNKNYISYSLLKWHQIVKWLRLDKYKKV